MKPKETILLVLLILSAVIIFIGIIALGVDQCADLLTISQLQQLGTIMILSTLVFFVTCMVTRNVHKALD
jgi:hypothetical protein